MMARLLLPSTQHARWILGVHPVKALPIKRSPLWAKNVIKTRSTNSNLCPGLHIFLVATNRPTRKFVAIRKGAISPIPILPASRIGSTTTIKDDHYDGMIITFDSARSVKFRGLSGESTAHKTNFPTNSAAIKDDGKGRTHRPRSSNTTADKNYMFLFSKQDVIAPPPNARKVAPSSKHVESPTNPAFAYNYYYGYYCSFISSKYN